MSTVLEPGVIEITDMEAFERSFDGDDFCHLKNPQTGVWACGHGSSRPHTQPGSPEAESWRSTGKCFGCRKPICPDCIAVVRSL